MELLRTVLLLPFLVLSGYGDGGQHAPTDCLNTCKIKYQGMFMDACYRGCAINESLKHAKDKNALTCSQGCYAPRYPKVSDACCFGCGSCTPTASPIPAALLNLLPLAVRNSLKSQTSFNNEFRKETGLIIEIEFDDVIPLNLPELNDPNQLSSFQRIHSEMLKKLNYLLQMVEDRTQHLKVKASTSRLTERVCEMFRYPLVWMTIGLTIYAGIMLCLCSCKKQKRSVQFKHREVKPRSDGMIYAGVVSKVLDSDISEFIKKEYPPA